MKNNHEHIEHFRRVIDRIDEMLISLLGERIRTANVVGQYKRNEGLELFDSEREDKVMKHIVALAKDHGVPEMEAMWFATGLLRMGMDAQRRNV